MRGRVRSTFTVSNNYPQVERGLRIFKSSDRRRSNNCQGGLITKCPGPQAIRRISAPRDYRLRKEQFRCQKPEECNKYLKRVKEHLGRITDSAPLVNHKKRYENARKSRPVNVYNLLPAKHLSTFVHVLKASRLRQATHGNKNPVLSSKQPSEHLHDAMKVPQTKDRNFFRSPLR